MTLSRSRLATLMIGLLTLLVAACGDSNNFEEVSGQQGGGNTPLVFSGNFLGANNLDQGQTAVLNLNVANSGQATGTLTVADPLVQLQGQNLNIAPGVYNVSGNVNMSTGAFTLSGSLPGIGNFSISGQLPVGTAQGVYNLVVNGQTFNGVIQNASQGTPNPPSGGGGGGGGGGERLIFGGTVNSLDFAADSTYNGVDLMGAFDPLITGAVVTDSDTQNIVTVALSETSVSGGAAAITSLVIGIVTQNGEELVVGQSYPMISAPNQTGSLISLSESVGTTVDKSWTITPPPIGSGSVKIVELTETGIVVEFNFDNVGPNTEVQGNNARGLFDASGRVSATFAPALR